MKKNLNCEFQCLDSLSDELTKLNTNRQNEEYNIFCMNSNGYLSDKKENLSNQKNVKHQITQKFITKSKQNNLQRFKKNTQINQDKPLLINLNKIFAEDQLYINSESKMSNNLSIQQEQIEGNVEDFSLNCLDMKECIKIVSQKLGKDISYQFGFLYKMFSQSTSQEIGCLERLWAEYEGNNVEKDVFYAAYILMNLSTFEKNSSMQKLSKLCSQLIKPLSSKSKQFQLYIQDISEIYEIRILNQTN